MIKDILDSAKDGSEQPGWAKPGWTKHSCAKNGTEKPASTSRLKNIVEQSLAVMSGGKGKDDTTKQMKIGSVRPSSLPVYIDDAYRRRGAIVEAAKALAELWKLSKSTGNSSRHNLSASKPPDRTFLQLKVTNGA